MKTVCLAISSILMILFGSCHEKGEQGKRQVQGHPINVELSTSPAEDDQSNMASEPIAANFTKSGPGNSGRNEDDLKPALNKNKIIKDGNISIKSKDISFSKKNIDELLKKLNGYYDSEDLQNNDQRITYTLKLRIPSENFEKAISFLENGNDEIISKSINARDVTEEYVDIEARLANKRNYLKKYTEILSRANSVKDILAIEENIRNLQEEIESKEGRLKYLNDQIAFSTLEINLFKEKEFIYKPNEQDKFTERLKKAFGNGWAAIVDFVILGFSIWPFILLAIIVIYIIRKRKIKQK